VVAAYDGEGDSGQINDITATAADESEVSLEGLPCGPDTLLADELDDFAWQCLGAYHGGFENNDGGYGDVTIDVTEGKVYIDHNDRFVDVTNTTSEV
jgi:hypothetical protein